MKKFASSMITLVAAGALVLPATVSCSSSAESARTDVTDAEIREAVEQEILLDAVVPLAGVEIAVTRGVVTLTGTVDNILDRDRAARLAETVRGARAVINRIDVRPEERPDPDIERDIRTALLNDPATEAYEVRVNVVDGVAQLEGTTQSWNERRLSEQVAKGVRGVRDVRNGIEVEFDAERSDQEILADVEARLKWDVLVGAALIDVAVNDGTVTLSGVVGSAAERSRALASAWVNGVRSIDADELTVAAWARDEDQRTGLYVPRDDGEIASALRDALLLDPRVNAFSVDVAVDDGAVTLTGTVGNHKARQAAEAVARNTTGVSGIVENRIEVDPFRRYDDVVLEGRLRESIERDPYLESFEIGTEVSDGKVTLSGSVDSYFERNRATDVAYRTNGVKEVDNRLVVGNVYNPFVYDPLVDDWFVFEHRDPSVADIDPILSDEEIESRVEDRLLWSPYVFSADIDVSVNHGVVTLDGEVASIRERTRAEENAYEGGALWVVNELTVRK